MSVWHVVLIASTLSLALKLSGYFVPTGVLEKPVVSRTANLMTVGLLAALVATQVFASGQTIVVDARLPAIIIAAVLFALRVPFVVVVIAAAAIAAAARAWTPLA